MITHPPQLTHHTPNFSESSIWWIDMELSGYDPWDLPSTSNKKMGKLWVGGHDHYRSIFFV